MAKKQTGKTAAKKATRTTKTTAPRKPAPRREVDVGDWDVKASEEEFTNSALSWEDRQLLGTVSRFLYTIVDPRFLRRAIRAGYTKVEHLEIWALFDRAAGRDQALDDQATTGLDSDPERKRLLVEVDEFENLWFPRTEKIIRRQVPEADTERFLATFFQNLKQQPLGPLVLDSVSTYLTRFDQLEHSKLPGAAKVHAALRARGVTPDKVAEIRGKIASLRVGTTTATPTVDPAVAAAGAKGQADAIRGLRLAWNDWSTTLRPLYDIREQIQLGLTEARNSGPSGAGGSGGGAGGSGGGTPPPAGATGTGGGGGGAGSGAPTDGGVPAGGASS